MAASNLASLKRRELLYQERPDQAKLNQAAEAELEADRLYHAVELFRRAGSKEKLEDVVALAVEQGDLFIYLEAIKALDRSNRAEELVALAQAAGRNGLERFAARAKSLAELEEADS